jgi:hypothetical protein
MKEKARREAAGLRALLLAFLLWRSLGADAVYLDLRMLAT